MDATPRPFSSASPGVPGTHSSTPRTQQCPDTVLGWTGWGKGEGALRHAEPCCPPYPLIRQMSQAQCGGFESYQRTK